MNHLIAGIWFTAGTCAIVDAHETKNGVLVVFAFLFYALGSAYSKDGPDSTEPQEIERKRAVQ